MKKVFFGFAVLVAAAVSVLGATMATAGNTGQAPVPYNIPWDPHDKPACGAGTAWSYKVEPVTSGVYGPISVTVNGSSFNWSILPEYLHTYDMGSILVKGGPSWVRVYDFTDPANDSWDGLTSAINPNNGKPYGLSHILICLDPKA